MKKLVVGVLAVGGCLMVQADTMWYAKPDGGDDSDCLSWETAGTIANAVSKMEASGAGTEDNRKWVVLRAGTPEEPAIYDLSSVSVPNANYIKISKGYSGICSEADDADPRRIWVKGGGADSPKRFLLITGGNARVRGLTIANFTWTGSNGYGAAMWVNTASSTVESCDFEDNQAAYCGAVYGEQAAVTGCTFRCNRATDYENAAALYKCKAVDCIFTSNANFAVREGIISNSLFVANLGGIGRSATLCGCEIVSNRVVDTVRGSCLAHIYGGTVRDCLFYGNASPEQAGTRWTADIISGAAVENCTFVTNETKIGRGGVYECTKVTNCTFYANYGSQPLCCYCRGVSGCLFVSNSCSQVLASGTIDRCRVLWNKGVAYALYSQIASTMSNCLIAHNTGKYAVDGYKGMIIRGCTIIDNDSSTAGVGSGFATAYPVSEISNSIITGNGSLDFETIRSDANYNCFTNVIYGKRSNGTGTWSGCKSLTKSELKFAEPDELHPYGYGLTMTSPATDEGFDLGYAPDALDLAGTNRVLGAAVDIGCYEYAPVVEHADYEIDPIADQSWGGSGTSEPHPTVRRKDDGTLLEEGVDYDLFWTDNGRIGTASVQVVGKGTYAGQSATTTFKVVSAYGPGLAFFAAPWGTDDADCSSFAHAGTISNAVARLNLAGYCSADAPNWVVLKSGTAETPTLYDLTDTRPPNGVYATLTVANSGIRTDAPDDDPRRTVVFGGGADAPKCFIRTSVVVNLIGFTMRGFVNTGTSEAHESYGSALYVGGQTPNVVVNCRFEENTGNGGAAAYGNNTTTFTNCVFFGNRSKRDNNCGAVWRASLVDCTFTSNRGAWAVMDGTVRKCRFVENCGGVSRNAALYDCLIVSNTVSDAVSGSCRTHMYQGSASNCLFVANVGPTVLGTAWTAALVSDITARDCLFVTNSISSGRGVYNSTVLNCTFVNNYGSLPLTGASRNLANSLFVSNWCQSAQGGTIRHCVFYGNKGTIVTQIEGNAMLFEGCLVTSNTCGTALSGGNYSRMRDCTVVDNACSTAGIGSGFATAYPFKEISNCIITGNGAKDFETIRSDANYNCFTNVIYGVRSNNTGTWSGCKPLTVAQVKFAEPDELHPYGYGLKKRSPAVDQGFDLGYAPDALDLAGVNRVIGAANDIGCYEYVPRRSGFTILVR